MPGTLFIVSTPIGNLEDISRRALRVLGEVRLIAAEDTRRTARLLAHYGITTRTTSLHEHNERRKAASLVARLEAGDDLALLTDAGTPGISDPGTALVRAAIDAGIRTEVIPGPSALTAALAGAGIEWGRVLFLGFLPSRAGERARALRQAAACPALLAFFEAPHRLGGMLEAVEEVFGPDVQVVIAHELTKVHESWHRGSVADLRKSELPTRGEFTILVNNQNAQPAIQSQRPVSVVEGSGPKTDLVHIYNEFCRLTNNGGLSRRDAIAELAARTGLRKREVYAAVEKLKQSGE